jgi:hypothetical protein
VGGGVGGRWRVREARRFVGEREQRITLGRAHLAARVFAEKKYHEGEDQAEADREGEWDDFHDELDSEWVV